jgi:hypothetical protein
LPVCCCHVAFTFDTQTPTTHYPLPATRYLRSSFLTRTYIPMICIYIYTSVHFQQPTSFHTTLHLFYLFSAISVFSQMYSTSAPFHQSVARMYTCRVP